MLSFFFATYLHLFHVSMNHSVASSMLYTKIGVFVYSSWWVRYGFIKSEVLHCPWYKFTMPNDMHNFSSQYGYRFGWGAAMYGFCTSGVGCFGIFVNIMLYPKILHKIGKHGTCVIGPLLACVGVCNCARASVCLSICPSICVCEGENTEIFCHEIKAIS